MQAFHHIKTQNVAVFAWCAEQLRAQLDQSFLWSPICMAIGIVAYFVLPVEPSWGEAAAIWIAPLLAFAAVNRQPWMRYVFFALLLMALGLSAAKLRTHLVYTPILERELSPVEISGTVEEIEYLAAGEGLRVVLHDVGIDRLEAEQTPRKVRIKFRKSFDVGIGDSLSGLVGLNPPSPPLLPGGFNYQRYMFFQGIGAIGFGYGAPEVEQGEERGGFASFLQRFRGGVVQEAMTEGDRNGAVAAALLVGHRAGISEEDQEAMRGSGLAHMLAISGLHIGLFFGVVFFVVRAGLAFFPRIALYHPIKIYAGIAGMIGVVFYMLAAGMTIPTQRAVFMTAAVFLAIVLNRTPLSMRLVAFAALIVLLFAPEALLSASFQMSFAAVAGLVAFYTAIRPIWSRWHARAGIMKRVWLYMMGVVLTSVVATFATAVFALFHFQQLALYGLLGNILAMPILAFVVMPFAVLFFVLLPFGGEGLALGVMQLGIGSILDIAHFVSGLQGSLLYMPLWPAWALSVFALGYVMLLVLKGPMRLAAVLPFVVFLIGALTAQRPDILISADMDVVAIAQEDGSLIYSNTRKNRFVREHWAQAFALQDREQMRWPQEGAGIDGLSCGEDGCRFIREKQKISIVRDLSIFGEECRWADVVVSYNPAPKCEEAHVIDKFSAWRNGAYAIYLDDLRIVSTADGLGQRPWVASAQ